MEECKSPTRHHQLHPRRLRSFFIHPSGPYTRSLFICLFKAKECAEFPLSRSPIYVREYTRFCYSLISVGVSIEAWYASPFDQSEPDKLSKAKIPPTTSPKIRAGCDS